MSKHLSYFFVLVLLIGCGVPKADSTSKAIINPDSKPVQVNKSFSKSIGKISFNGIPICTAFAVSSHEIITAAHCVPKTESQLRLISFSLDGGIQLSVDSVVARWSESDVIRLRVEPSQYLEPLQKENYSSGSAVSIVTAHLSGSRIGLSATSGSVISMTPNSAEFLHSANTLPGYSGSPILQNNKVIGVHLGTTHDHRKNVGMLISADLLQKSRLSLVLEVEGPFDIGIAVDLGIGAGISSIATGMLGSAAGGLLAGIVTSVLIGEPTGLGADPQAICTGDGGSSDFPNQIPEAPPMLHGMACLTSSAKHQVEHEGQVDVRIAFDPFFYSNQYFDLKSAFGNDIALLTEHFERHGKSEGRRPSYFIDPIFYLKSYPDLQQAFGENNYAAAYDHWLTSGITEGRRGSAEFAVRNYLENYPDLKSAFGTNFAAAMHHYLANGIRERRNTL